MKHTSTVIMTGIAILVLGTAAISQSYIEPYKAMVIEPYHVNITLNKTTHLIFPCSIKSVDRGSGEVLAQKAKGVDNILLVKAGRENFTETNLSVITTDGKLYSFLLDYTSNPSLLNLSFTEGTISEGTTSLL